MNSTRAVDIAFIAPAGPPDDHRYFYKQLLTLQDAGKSVAFVCKEGNVRTELIKGPVSRLNPRETKLSRATGGLSLLRRVLTIKPEAIQICSVELLPLAIVMKLLGKSVFYDCREDMPTSIREHKVDLPKSIRIALAALVEWMEHVAARAFDGISVSDRWIERKFQDLGARKVFYFPNFPRLEDFPETKEAKVYDFCVLGSMSTRTGVIEVLDALVLLTKSGWTGAAVLIGAPSSEVLDHLASIREQHNVRVDVTGRVPYSEVPRRLAECRVGLIPLRDMKKFGRNVATKMFEYSASGLQIIATDLLPQREFLAGKSFASLVEPNSSLALFNAMSEALVSCGTEIQTEARAEFERSWNINRYYPLLIEYYAAESVP